MLLRFSWIRISSLLLVCLAGLNDQGQAQNTNGIFLTPVPNAPFSGVIVVQRTRVSPAVTLRSTRDVARDGQGRIYNVFRAMVPTDSSQTPPTIRVHVYDPQTRDYAFVYPQQKNYITGTVHHPPAANPADLIASPAGNSVPLSPYTKQEDLGTKRIGEVSAHGVRQTQTIPAGDKGAGKEIVLTDEYWYADELHMNVEVKHDDPRIGSVTMTLTQVSRSEPDPSLFQIPEGYQPRIEAGEEAPEPAQQPASPPTADQPPQQ